MKTWLTIVGASALLCAAPAAALAQSVEVVPPSDPKAAQAQPTPVAPVVVPAPRLHPCRDRDRKCIADVIAEVWRRFPDKVQTWCSYEETRLARERFNTESIMEGANAVTARGAVGFKTELPPAERQLCAAGPHRALAAAPQPAAASTASTNAAPPSGERSR